MKNEIHISIIPNFWRALAMCGVQFLSALLEIFRIILKIAKLKLGERKGSKYFDRFGRSFF
jgi:hypothetical protein